MAIKSKTDLLTELKFGKDKPRDILQDVVNSTLAINGIINLDTVTSGSDPGVNGKLFITASEAIDGAGPGYEIICLSKG